MKNRKAELLSEETVKIIIAVIGIGFLFYAGSSAYGMFRQDTRLEQAKVNLDRIYSEIEKIESGEKATAELLIESPKDWWILAWPYKENIEKPIQCKKDYCICICEIPTIVSQANSLDNCNSEGICRDVSMKIKTISSIGNVPLDIREVISVKIYLQNGETIVEEIK